MLSFPHEPSDPSRAEIVPVDLLALPPLAAPLMERLLSAGFLDCALFGGAVRDADCSAAWGVSIPIKDYDVRVWISGETEERALERISRALGCASRPEPSLGTGRVRHVFEWRGSEIDLSIRPAPAEASSHPARVAIERAADSDAALGSVALASDLSAWARPEYLLDRDGDRLSFFPSENPERLAAYIARMSAKFPGRPVRMLQYLRAARSPHRAP